MHYAKHIGRVGALAVALGVGMAVATTPGVAWATPEPDNANATSAPDSTNADDLDRTTDTKSSSTPPATASDPTDSPSTTHTTSTTAQSPSETTQTNQVAPNVVIRSSGGALTSDRHSDTPPTELQTPPPVTLPADQSTPPSLDTPNPVSDPAPANPRTRSSTKASEGISPRDPSPSPVTSMLRVATADTTSTAAHPDATQRHTSALQASAIETDQTGAHRDSMRIAAVTSVTQPTAPAATDPIAALLNVGTTFIATTSKVVTAVLASFATPAPGAPADSPLMWAVLAIVRRQFFNETPSITPTVSAPDALGNITISLKETDADGDRLVYSATNGSKGAVSLNADGHSFTYDPTAGASGTDSITITATDTTNAHIHGLPGLLDAFTFGLLGTSGHTASTTVTVTATNAPTLTTASIGAPEQTTGAVTVTLVAADADDDPLTLTVTQPASASGTVSAPVLIDAATGTYTVTYTPTGQARLDAYESAGDDFDSFTVDVSDGHYPAVEATVSHVPISPAEAAVTGTIPVGRAQSRWHSAATVPAPTSPPCSATPSR